MQKILSQYSFDSFGMDDDYRGFNQMSFEPEDEIFELTELFKDEPQIQNKIIEVVRIETVLKQFNLTGNIESVINAFNKVKIEPNEVFVSINVKLALKYLDNEKTEFEYFQFLGYLGIRSIQGRNRFAKTNNETTEANGLTVISAVNTVTLSSFTSGDTVRLELVGN